MLSSLMPPKYTFLLPAYKAKYLREMLDSISMQTFADFKVVISDDCSPEPIREICEPYLSDERFSYRRNIENMGGKSLVSHWNLLVDLCDTEYLIMASDDDVYSKDFLEHIDKLSNIYPDVDLLRARAQIIDGEGYVMRQDGMYLERASQLEFMIQYEQIGNVACVANYVFKTKTLKDKGGFVNYPLAWKSDTMTTNIIAANGVANTKDILFDFRVSGINISSIERKDVLQKKFIASFMKDVDMTTLIGKLKQEQLSKLDVYMLSALSQKHIERTISEIGYFAVALPFVRFFDAIKHFNKKRYFKSKFEIILLWKKWLYFHTH